jgi:SAM-dependent methyltransferase
VLAVLDSQLEPSAVDYWDSYYRNRGVPKYPSQFAAFVTSVAEDVPFIVDCGCGSGRDSLFFARIGKAVFGIDASHEAVEICRSQAERCGLIDAKFDQADITDRVRTARIAGQVRERSCGGQVLVYARFFLHALDDRGQVAFLNFARKICGRQDMLAVEFRTHRDRYQEKATASHYRRYINPTTFVYQAQQMGFVPQYQIEGFGFAKYKDDDAHVYRGIFSTT